MQLLAGVIEVVFTVGDCADVPVFEHVLMRCSNGYDAGYRFAPVKCAICGNPTIGGALLFEGDTTVRMTRMNLPKRLYPEDVFTVRYTLNFGE
jgi:hypothetical protein